MSPVERLQAAIEKLETLRSQTGYYESHGWLVENITTGPEHDPREEQQPLLRDELLVTLHRTIDAQLETLHAAWNTIAGTEEMPDGKDPKVWYGRYAAAALALADAILGSDQ